MRIFNILFGVVFTFLIGTKVIAQEFPVVSEDAKKSVLVLSERVEQANSKYLIYPEVSEMIASEIINKLNTDGAIKAPALSNVREALRTPELIYYSSNALKDFRYTYQINYKALKKIGKHFNTDNIVLVTGALDTATDFLKPTWWNFLNIPGENVVKTEYRLYTYIALVNLNSETVTWQNTYHRQITAPEFALANATYSPDYRQLTKIKKGSLAIAKDASYRIENVITPWFAKQTTPPTVHELVKYKVNQKYTEYVQNINDYKTNLKEKNAQKTNEKNVNENKIKDAVLTKLKSTNSENKIEKNLEPAQLKTPANSRIEEYLQEEDNIKEKNIQVSPLNIIIPKL